MRMTDTIGVLVVCDGCSSGAHSEIGAALGAAWTAELVVSCGGDVELAITRLIKRLSRVVRGSAEPRLFVREHMLFTLIVAVITPLSVRVYGRGDGIVCINGERTVRDSGVENAPDYLSYALVNGTCPSQVDMWAEAATHDVDFLAIGTDGAVDANELLLSAASEPVFARNASWLQRQLWAHEQSLIDDTAIVLLRRKEGA